jgi:hypothetical protein
VQTRSGVSRKPVVQPVQPGRGGALERVPSATLHNHSASPARKQPLRPRDTPATSALHHRHAISSQSSMSSRRIVAARECSWVALRAAILSGFPSIKTSSFEQCPFSGPIPSEEPHDRRPRRMPLAREDIPPFSFHEFNRSDWPGVIPNFNLWSLHKGAVQYGAYSESTCLVGQGGRSGGKTDSARCEIGRP